MSDEDQQMEILKNIEQLQNMEKELYKEISQGAGTAGARASEAGSTGPSTAATGPLNLDATINRINQLSQIRMSLYETLNNSFKSLQNNVNTKRTELVQLLTVVSVVEEELNNAKVQLNQLNEIKDGKMRMVEINTYYGKKYRAQSSLMKLIIFVGVILLIIAILRQKGLLPEGLGNLLFGVVFAVGGFFILRRTLDLSFRDNMNFDAYNWFYNPDTQVPTVYEYNKKQFHGLMSSMKDAALPAVFNGIDCIGNACCTAGMTYDSAARKCIKTVAPETFVTGQLTKHVFNNKDSGPMTGAGTSTGDSNPNYPSPYGDGEMINFASY
jgi:hypothetical protein